MNGSKGVIHQKDLTILKEYVPNTVTPTFTKQNSTKSNAIN